MMKQPTANPAVTFTPTELQAVIAAAIKEHEAAKKGNTSDDMDKACIRAFARNGMKGVKPRVDVLTYGKWIAAGRKVKEGEKSVKVKNLRLFHVSQTEAITEKEKQDILAAKAPRTADRLPPVSPVTPISAAKKAKPAPQPSA
jgi:hypothetical protein